MPNLRLHDPAEILQFKTYSAFAKEANPILLQL